jgi:hypothetical protein
VLAALRAVLLARGREHLMQPKPVDGESNHGS